MVGGRFARRGGDRLPVMSTAERAVSTVVWTDPDHAGLIEQALGRMDRAALVAIGGPRRSALAPLAESFGTDVTDDLRQLLNAHPARFLLLATSQGVHRRVLEQAGASGMVVLALEPPDEELAALQAPEPSTSGTVEPTLITVPWLRMSPAWLSAADPGEAIGTPHAIELSVLGPPGAGSLYARLYDAMECLIHLAGAPDSIDASLTGVLTSPPEDLAAMTGHLTAHCRFASGAAATLLVSDRAAAFSRRLVALGSDAQLHLTDTSYELSGPGGEALDSGEADPPLEAHDFAGLIVRQWQRLIDRPRIAAPADGRNVLAACRAALLSARTGETERPETWLHIRGG